MTPERRQGGPAWQCNGDIRDWPSEWYTQPWYTENADYWNDLAGQGIINPPWSVWGSLCGTPTFPSIPPASSSSSSSSLSATSDSTSPTSRATSLATSPPPSPEATVALAASSLQSGTIAGSPTTHITATAMPTTQMTMATATATATTASPWTSAPVNPGFAQWDYQAKGTVVAAALAIGLGGLLWGLWAILRPRLKALYAPRSWFLPAGSRPPAGTLAVALLPFLHLPPLNAPASDAQVMTHVVASALGIAALSATVGVGAFLPLSIANVPHLLHTTPRNERGGKLGSLTDLSLLRLLNAHDPPPGAPTSGAVLVTRDVAPYLAPAMSGPRIRLIAILVLMTVLSVGGTLFIVWRTYAKFTAYALRFDQASEGQSMVFIPAEKAPAWQGLTETGIRRRLLIGPRDEGSVAGVFAIGRFDAIKELARERAHVLDVLEQAEASYIASFPANTTSPNPTHHSSPQSSRRLSYPVTTASSSGSLFGPMGDFEPQGEGGSAFLEVNQRHSVLRRLGKLNVGDAVVRDEDGTFLPANAPEPKDTISEKKNAITPPKDLATALEESGNRESYMTLSSDLTPPPTDRGYQPLASRPQSTLDPSILADFKAKITWSRIRLRKLNVSIDTAQQEAMKDVANGNGATVGWIIVGRGVTSFPCARELPGRTKEDILWDNLGPPTSHRDFWICVACVGGIIAAIFIPFMGLAVAAAPGFAHCVRFLKPLARSDSFGAGVVGSLVPAIVVILLVSAGITIVQRLARQTKPASYSELRFLSLKGTTYLLLLVGSIWVIALGSILFGVDAYAQNARKACTVADGVMFISWLCLVLIIALCIPAPGIAVLQPHRLIRRMMRVRNAITPRQKFHLNQPPNYHPATALAALLAGMFYLCALCGVFPLISVPAVLLAYLALVAHQYLTSRVFCVTRGGMSDGSVALWVVRRLGWAAALQPLIFGLVLLSRREWAIGGAGIGIAVLAVAASEVITVTLHHRKRPSCFSDVSLTDDVPDASERETMHRRVESDHSALARFHVLLPGLGRLASDNPLPFPTDAIDDYISTDRAMRAVPDTADVEAAGPSQTNVIVTPPSDTARGLIYPPELLLPTPTVWLPGGDSPVAQQEADSLAVEGLTAVVDPQHDTRAPAAPVQVTP